MTDELARLTPVQVAGFYKRLADLVDMNKGRLAVSLAAMLMRQWLANRDAKSVFEFEAPDHLKEHSDVLGAVRYHRAVYLTEQRANVTGGSSKWAGIVPRLQGKGYPKWNGSGEMKMEYQSLVELPLRYQLTGSDADRDLLYALHGFQLKTNVAVTAQGSSGGRKVRISFTSFQARVDDRYDWDYSEHLTVPNPDFGSTAAGAVAPKSKTLVVYHSNAKRIEDAGLAAPYDLESKPWAVTDAGIVGPGEVDTTRSL